jgi:hypothetical protein
MVVFPRVLPRVLPGVGFHHLTIFYLKNPHKKPAIPFFVEERDTPKTHYGVSEKAYGSMLTEKGNRPPPSNILVSRGFLNSELVCQLKNNLTILRKSPMINREYFYGNIYRYFYSAMSCLW